MKRQDFVDFTVVVAGLALLGIILSLLLLGCGSGPELTTVTPATAVYLSDRTITDGNEIHNTLLLWQGQRETEAKIAYSVTSIPGYTLRTIDNCWFQCGYSDTGWCNGGYHPDGKIIEAPIYHRLKFTHVPVAVELIGTAKHTLISSDEIFQKTWVNIWKDLGFWYVGYIPSGGIGYPVLGHEIGHLLGRSVDSGNKVMVTEAYP